MGVCSVYSAFLNQYEKSSIQFQPNFINGLNSLSGKSMNEYYNFIDTFGTHIITEMKMGSRYGEVSKFSEDSYLRLKKEGVNIDVAAEATIKGVSISSGTSTSTEKDQGFKYSSARMSKETHTVGSIPPKNESVNAWAQQSFNSPAPIKLTLESIEATVQRALGGKSNHPTLSTLISALSSYCVYLRDVRKEIKDCNAPAPNRPLVSKNSCRLCSQSCGSSYDVDGGSISVNANWPDFY